jgi:cell division protein FtsB
MVEKKLIALGLICVVLSVGVFGAVMALNQKDVQMQIKTDQISGLENEKNTLETQVSTLQANVSGLQSEVVSLENLTLSLETQVSNLQSEVTSLENEVIQSFNLGYAEGESEGYQLGYDEGYVQGVEDGPKSGWYISDPTYDEAIAFINLDKTDENEYTPDYICYDFTAYFDTNAFQMGYRCGFVYIEFSDSAHAIACFNTIDRGLIYIEPQNDEIVTIAIGQTYLGYIIVDLAIIW